MTLLKISSELKYISEDTVSQAGHHAVSSITMQQRAR